MTQNAGLGESDARLIWEHPDTVTARPQDQHHIAYPTAAHSLPSPEFLSSLL